MQNLRLQFIIDQIEEYGSQASFARAIGKPPQQITQWLNGKAIGEKIARDIEIALDLPHGYMDKTPTELEELEEGTFRIPEYEVKLAASPANHGCEVIHPNNIIKHHVINNTFLQEFGVKEKNLAVVSVIGDSMEPTVRDKERVVIDISNRQEIDNRIFAITTRNHTWIKRLRITPAGSKWQSDNEEYREYDADLNNGSSVRIEGLVLYSLGRKLF